MPVEACALINKEHLSLNATIDCYDLWGTRCTNTITKLQTYDPYFGKTSDLVATPSVPIPIDFACFPRCELAITAVTESTPAGCCGYNQMCQTYAWWSNPQRHSPTLYFVWRCRHEPGFGIQRLEACPYTDNECTEGEGTCLKCKWI